MSDPRPFFILQYCYAPMDSLSLFTEQGFKKILPVFEIMLVQLLVKKWAGLVLVDQIIEPVGLKRNIFYVTFKCPLAQIAPPPPHTHSLLDGGYIATDINKQSNWYSMRELD